MIVARQEGRQLTCPIPQLILAVKAPDTCACNKKPTKAKQITLLPPFLLRIKG